MKITIKTPITELHLVRHLLNENSIRLQKEQQQIKSQIDDASLELGIMEEDKLKRQFNQLNDDIKNSNNVILDIEELINYKLREITIEVPYGILTTINHGKRNN